MLIFYMLSVLVCVVYVNSTPSHSPRWPQETEYFCIGNDKIISKFFHGLYKGYAVVILKELEAATEIRVKLDSGGAIKFGDRYEEPGEKERFTERDLINNVYSFIVRQTTSNYTFTVKGSDTPAYPPYIISLKIDGVENCKNPNRTYFEHHDLGIAYYWPDAPDKFCGRRRINKEYTELIVDGTSTSSGDWPWHTAIYRNQGHTVQYVCGGTLISKFIVLTAAHCVTINEVPVNPQMLGVVLGKFALIGSEITTQDRTVYEVVVHDDFRKKNFDNDIALLKLSVQANFNNYVQPACLWLDEVYNQLESFEIMGTIVGWGIDQSDSISNKLKEAKIPLVPNLTCINDEPVFYTSILTDKKFCAGNGNGTAACNGDSGGGFVVFVRDSKYFSNDLRLGAWYVRGIVSVTLKRSGSNLCDPQAYTVLTDVAKYRDWILQNMN